MSDWLEIPQDRPQSRPQRLAVLMGLTILLVLVSGLRAGAVPLP
ncbi:MULTISPECIES: hypothetical protein [Gemmobacter]|jgi:hypothetical protein|uniref:Uncharacterized protein n=1 Tax=Gemmobacter nanjingensis TaxID=488454 RepID=A0ABQ3FES3_9RHOB|nr:MULTISPECIES: hypothetical protein [Gemmobacter]GHC21066.1 hypothetical protein GCM10007291_20060 [Gemmobacter nanjingensis]